MWFLSVLEIIAILSYPNIWLEPNIEMVLRYILPHSTLFSGSLFQGCRFVIIVLIWKLTFSSFFVINFILCFRFSMQTEYEDECITWIPISVNDNQSCVDLLDGRLSIFSILNEVRRNMSTHTFSRIHTHAFTQTHALADSYTVHSYISVYSHAGCFILFMIGIYKRKKNSRKKTCSDS